VSKALIHKLDKIFSEYIRLKNADENGVCTCISCGKKAHWKNMDCGHYIKRQFKSVRFNENNCWPQDRHCNYFLQGNDANYRKNLVKKIGEQKVLLLEAQKRVTKKWTRFEIEALIEHYTQEVKKLKL